MQNATRQIKLAVFVIVACYILDLSMGSTAPADWQVLLAFHNSTQGDGWMEGFQWTKVRSLTVGDDFLACNVDSYCCRESQKAWIHVTTLIISKDCNVLAHLETPTEG